MEAIKAICCVVLVSSIAFLVGCIGYGLIFVFLDPSRSFISKLALGSFLLITISGIILHFLNEGQDD